MIEILSRYELNSSERFLAREREKREREEREKVMWKYFVCKNIKSN